MRWASVGSRPRAAAARRRGPRRANRDGAVEDQQAVLVIDAGAGAGRRGEVPQKRRDPLRVDGEFEARRIGLVEGRQALAGLHLEQQIGIDRDEVAVDGRRGGDGGGDDLALDAQALDAGIDQAGAPLVEKEDARRRGAARAARLSTTMRRVRLEKACRPTKRLSRASPRQPAAGARCLCSASVRRCAGPRTPAVMLARRPPRQRSNCSLKR